MRARIAHFRGTSYYQLLTCMLIVLWSLIPHLKRFGLGSCNWAKIGLDGIFQPGQSIYCLFPGEERTLLNREINL